MVINQHFTLLHIQSRKDKTDKKQIIATDEKRRGIYKMKRIQLQQKNNKTKVKQIPNQLFSSLNYLCVIDRNQCDFLYTSSHHSASAALPTNFKIRCSCAVFVLQ